MSEPTLPSTISNLSSWWDPKGGDTYLTGDPDVSAWTPRAGSVSEDLVQATAGKQPSRTTFGVNNQIGLRFEGDDTTGREEMDNENIDATAYATSDTWTFAAALQQHTSKSGNLELFGSETATSGERWSFRVNASGLWEVIIGAAAAASTGPTVGEVEIIVVTVNTTDTGIIRHNSVEVESAVPGPSGITSLLGITVGHHPFSGNTTYAPFNYGDLIVWDKELSGAEIDTVEAYLNYHWKNAYPSASNAALSNHGLYLGLQLGL